MDSPLLQRVKARLEAARGHWPEIARATGVPYFTLTNIVQGRVRDPRISTVEKLNSYFLGRPRKAPAKRRPRHA